MRLTNADDRALFKNVWAVAEMREGRVLPVTRELVGAARKLADSLGAEVWVALPGAGDAAAKDIEGLFLCGADVALVAGDKRLAPFNDELEANLLCRLIEKHKPEVVLGAATAHGRALMPRVAVKTESGLTADCTGLAIDPETGELLQTRPAFGGNILATIRSPNHRPQMATVRPRVMVAPEPDPARAGKGRIVREGAEAPDFARIKEILASVQEDEGATVNLSDAKIIVSGGRAMKGPEGFKLLKELADAVGGAVGASRAAVDSGWIPYPHQVGQTGQTVQTDVYIACGISGQIQHLVGMQSCKVIVAIDVKPDTPMMQLADVAVNGDLFEVIPALLDALRKKDGAAAGAGGAAASIEARP